MRRCRDFTNTHTHTALTLTPLVDNVRTQLSITKAAIEASEARVAALQAELVQMKVTNERVMHQLGALSSLHNTDVLHATNLKEQVQLYAGEVPNTDADTLEQLRAKYEHLYTNVFGQIAGASHFVIFPFKYYYCPQFFKVRSCRAQGCIDRALRGDAQAEGCS